MGYWVEGDVEGELLLDFTVDFLVKGVESNYHSGEWFKDMLEFSETLCEVADIPCTWLEGGGWEIKRASVVYEDDAVEDGEAWEADYRVLIEFLEVAIPFSLEDWSAKLVCAEDTLAQSIPVKEHESDLRRESPRGSQALHLTGASVRAEFSGKGEDGEEFECVSLSTSIPLAHQWGRWVVTA